MPNKLRDDEQLLAAWQQGDTDAGDLYIERHFLSVFRFFSTKLPAEADDLTQQTFTDLHGAVSGIRNPASGRAYVMQIARNRLYMRLRSRAAEERLFDPHEMSISAVDPNPRASGLLVGHQDVRRLLAALRVIPLNAQIVLELYYWEELPVRDIAMVIGVQPGTVMSRLFRARERLNAAFGADAADVLEDRSFNGFETWANDVGKVARGGASRRGNAASASD